MTAGAVVTDITVVKAGGCPGDGAVAAAAFEGGDDMVGGFSGGRCTVMAVGAI